MNQHTCWAPGCNQQVRGDMLMCRPHWYAVPKPIRNEVWRAYRNHGSLTEPWLKAVKAAQDSLQPKEATSQMTLTDPTEENP